MAVLYWALLEVLFHEDEVQVVAEGSSEALVAVGEGLGLSGEGVAAALVPGDEGFADVEYGHADAATAARLGKLLG